MDVFSAASTLRGQLVAMSNSDTQIQHLGKTIK